MKRIIIMIIAVMFVLSSNAQKLGITGGWNFENFDISARIGDQLKVKNANSWQLGAVAQIRLSGNIFVQPEILYIDQKFDVSNLPIVNDSQNMEFKQIQIPINLLYKVLKIPVVLPFVSAGPYYNAITSKNDGAGSLKNTYLGLSLGAGIEFSRIQLSFRYNWAIKDISRIENTSFKNNVFNVSVAFFIF